MKTPVPLISLRSPALAGDSRIEWEWPAIAYERTPPAWLHLPETAAGLALREHYGRLSAKLGPQAVFSLKNLTVQGKGVMLMGGGLVRENLEGAPVARLTSELSERGIGAVERVIDEPVLYAHRYGVRNYGHCLTDIIPKAVAALRRMPDLRWALHPEMPRQALEAIRALGIPANRTLTLDERPTLLRQAWFAQAWNAHPLVHTPSTFEMLSELCPPRPAAGAARSRRLFVTRHDASTRRLSNHAQVSQWLKARGFEELTCGPLPLAEQVAAFRAAEMVVGIAGAAMTNICFCEAGTRVVTLAPDSMPALYFWDLAHHARLDWRIAYFPADAVKGIHADFAVDLETLQRSLA
jgi:hypothetical protein